MIGASGAIAAIISRAGRCSGSTGRECRSSIGFTTFAARSGPIWALLVWVGIEVIERGVDSGQGGGVAHWAHVGGFVAGAIAAPFIGSVRAAKNEYFSDDPADNVEYVRRSEQVTAAERALRADPNNAYLMRRLAQASVMPARFS